MMEETTIASSDANNGNNHDASIEVVSGVDENQEQDIINNFLEAANAAGKGPQYIPASELDETILTQNVDAGGNITTSTTAKGVFDSRCLC